MGAVGSACVRDCVRSSHENAAEDLFVSSVGPSSSSTGPRPDNADCVQSPRDGNSMVPPVPNWFQVLQNNRTRDAPAETPRFDEVLQSPRVDAPGNMPTDQLPLTTPRSTSGDTRTPALSPRDSPRPAVEDAAGMKSTQGIYEGTYLGNMKHGCGKLRMNACTYEGEFLNDFKHGHGSLSWDDGRLYQGQFEYGKFHGCATMAWPDGRKYLGQYSEDRKHGDGIFSWQDGRRYDGQWVCGKRHGVGVYTNAKGLTRRGLWQMDRPLQWDPVDMAPPAAAATRAPVPRAAPDSAGHANLKPAMDVPSQPCKPDSSDYASPHCVSVTAQGQHFAWKDQEPSAEPSNSAPSVASAVPPPLVAAQVDSEPSHQETPPAADIVDVKVVDVAAAAMPASTDLPQGDNAPAIPPPGASGALVSEGVPMATSPLGDSVMPPVSKEVI